MDPVDRSAPGRSPTIDEGSGGPSTVNNEEEPTNRFVRIADRVSYLMGTWQNILVWIILVGLWFALGPYFANHAVLPDWFTSNNFNFPLNTVTTIVELYIGFLVGASTNRTERHNRNQADRMEKLENLIHQELQRNTSVTIDAHALETEVNAQIPLVQETNALVERLYNLHGPVTANGRATKGS
jgi:low affinity Fe/Cu permease